MRTPTPPETVVGIFGFLTFMLSPAAVHEGSPSACPHRQPRAGHPPSDLFIHRSFLGQLLSTVLVDAKLLLPVAHGFCKAVDAVVMRQAPTVPR